MRAWELEAGIRAAIRFGVQAIRAGAYERACTLLERAEKDAEALGELGLLVEARDAYADALRMADRYDEAIARYGLIIALAEDRARRAQVLADNATAVRVARAYDLAADCLRNSRADRAQAHRVLDQGLRFVEVLRRPELAQGFHVTRGRLFQQEGQLERAREELEIALALRQRHPDAPCTSLGSTASVLADVLLDLGRDGEAEKRFRLALENQPDPYERAWALRGLAWIAFRRGDLGEAESRICQALAQAQTIEDPSLRSHMHDYRARIRAEQGALSDALAGADAALAVLPPLPEDDPASPTWCRAAIDHTDALSLQADLLLRAERLPEARQRASEACALAARAQHLGAEADAVTALAEIALAERSFLEAQALAAEARALADEAGKPAKRFWARAALAQALAAQNRNDALDQLTIELQTLLPQVEADFRVRARMQALQDLARLARAPSPG